MDFKIPSRIIEFNKANVPIINRIFDYITSRLSQRTSADEVTFSTNMNTDVAGKVGDIVRCSSDNKFYGCTVGGVAGSATWVSFN